MSAMNTLLILRHAKAVSHADRDDDRALTPRGEDDACRVGAHLAAEGLIPDLILASDALRTLQTARLVAQGCGLAQEHVQANGILYMAQVSVLVEELRNVSDDVDTLLLVGHNPDLHALAEWLGADDLPSFPTAALARFSVDSDTWDDLGPWQCRYHGTFTPH